MKTPDQIKSLIAAKGLNPTQVSLYMGWKSGTLNAKLRRGSLKFDEVKEICSLIGYKLEFLNEDTARY